MIWIDQLLERHVEGQHAATVSIQLDADLNRCIQSHHGVMQHGGNKVPQCSTRQYIRRVVIT